MLDSEIPDRIPIIWARDAGGAYINPIPSVSQQGINDGYASWPDGFVPLNFLDPSAGGVPPRGRDFNGVLKIVSSGIRWLQAGGLATYNSEFSTAIGGYPYGAVLSSGVYVGLLWISTVNNNLTNPDTGGVGWQPFNRWRLPANTTFYVDAVLGNNNNDGLSAGSPFKTIARARYIIGTFIDLSGYIVTVKIKPGDYNEDGIWMSGPIQGATAGASSLVFEASEGAVNITTTTASGIFGALGAVSASNGAVFTLKGNNFVLSAPSGEASIVAGLTATEMGSVINIDGNITFGVARDAHIYVGPGSQVRYHTGLTDFITGAAPRHWLTIFGFLNLGFENLNINISGVPDFSNAFVECVQGRISAVGLTVAGSATGKRYIARENGVISTGSSGNPAYFPGNIAGSTSLGGQYD